MLLLLNASKLALYFTCTVWYKLLISIITAGFFGLQKWHSDNKMSANVKMWKRAFKSNNGYKTYNVAHAMS